MSIRVVVVDDNPHVRWDGLVYPVNATFHRFLSGLLDIREPDGTASVAEIVHCVPLRDATTEPETLPLDPRIRVVGTAPFDGIAGYLRHLGGMTRRNRATLAPEIAGADLVWLKVPASNGALAAWLAARAARPRFVYVAGSARDVVRGQARGFFGQLGAMITATIYDSIGGLAAWRGGRRIVVGEGIVAGDGIVTTLVEPAELRDPARSEWPAEPGRLHLAWAGRLVAGKGLEAVLDAVGAAPRWGLVVIGDGPDRTRLEKHAALSGANARVEWRGYVADRGSYLDAIAQADAFVFPSPAEGFPKVILDAMAVGVPVLATAAGGLTELVRGDLVESIASSSGGAVADALQRLEDAGQERVDRLRTRGHAFAVEHTRPAEAARLVERWRTWWPDLPWDG